MKQKRKLEKVKYSKANIWLKKVILKLEEICIKSNYIIIEPCLEMLLLFKLAQFKLGKKGQQSLWQLNKNKSK